MTLQHKRLFPKIKSQQKLMRKTRILRSTDVADFWNCLIHPYDPSNPSHPLEMLVLP